MGSLKEYPDLNLIQSIVEIKDEQSVLKEDIAQQIFNILDGLGLNYKIYKHNTVYSCQESEGIIIPGVRAKNLLLGNRKSTNFYMAVLPGERQLKINNVRNFFNDSKLSFVYPDLMENLIGLKPGSVSPYALINNTEKNIRIIFDNDLEGQMVGFHPLRNDYTIVSKMSVVEKFLEKIGFEFDYTKL